MAGNVGLGAAKAVQDADAAAGSQKVNMMWVDVDGCISAAQYCKYFITSVEKGIVPSVKTAVLSAPPGTFKGGTYIGTLANGGAVLAPFHDFASKVPAVVADRARAGKGGHHQRHDPDADEEPGVSKPAARSECGSGAA